MFLEGVSSNSCCQISGASLCCGKCQIFGVSFLFEGVCPKLLLPDLWGQLVFCLLPLRSAFLGRAQPQTLAARSLSGASLCVGRCQPQTLAAGSLGSVFFWNVSAPNSCCQICGSVFWGEVSAPNSCCRFLLGPVVFGRCHPQALAQISGASLCFGRCQPQTLAGGSLGPDRCGCGFFNLKMGPEVWQQEFWR